MFKSTGKQTAHYDCKTADCIIIIQKTALDHTQRSSYMHVPLTFTPEVISVSFTRHRSRLDSRCHPPGTQPGRSPACTETGGTLLEKEKNKRSWSLSLPL